MTEQRLKILLCNVLYYIEMEEGLLSLSKKQEIDWLCNEFGITKEELKEIEFI